MALDVELNDLIARVASLLVDLDLMQSEPYFTAADIATAVGSVSGQLDAMLHAKGFTRATFLVKVGTRPGSSGYFIAKVMATFTEKGLRNESGTIAG